MTTSDGGPLMPRMIECPNCVASDDLQPIPSSSCRVCEGTEEIPDRRRQTANDRAVERIKAECSHCSSSPFLDDYENGIISIKQDILTIIREEQEADDAL